MQSFLITAVFHFCLSSYLAVFEFLFTVKIACFFLKHDGIPSKTSSNHKRKQKRNVSYTPVLFLRWHRLGLSVKGNSITLLVDCETNTTLLLRRPSPSHVSNAGIILLGQQLLEEKYFDVSDRHLVPWKPKAETKGAFGRWVFSWPGSFAIGILF